MNYRLITILLMIGLTIVAVALVFIVAPNNVFGRILTLPLVLVLPGYALTYALFTNRVLGVPERLVLSLGLSLVIVILGGLVLNWTPFGLRASSWAVLLSSITLGASVVALIRGRGERASRSGWVGIGLIGLNFRQGLLLSMAGVVLCGAVAVSIIGAVRQPFPGFTQLWILPANGANKNAVRLGMNDRELTAVKYKLSVRVDGQVVKVWPSIDLRPNEKWEATLIIAQTTHTGAARVEADLYRGDAPTKIYRHVVLLLGT
jgi:uncharacterized membrane protein